MQLATGPMSEMVYWNKQQKIIGVLGVAPLATSDFYQKLCARNLEKDWLHPQVILFSNPKIPSRGRYLELNETNPISYIKQDLQTLVSLGAEVIAIPCNTAHILYDEYTQGLDVEIPHIVQLTVKECYNRKVKCALILASTQIIAHNLYQKELSFYNIPYEIPHDQNYISSIITAAKQGFNPKIVAQNLFDYIESMNLPSGTCIISGCTEISILINEFFKKNEKYIICDSSQILADYCYLRSNS